jgi:hypothetical protein
MIRPHTASLGERPYIARSRVAERRCGGRRGIHPPSLRGQGGGHSIIAGQRFDWVEGDTFVVPSWAWHEHASAGGEAVLFSFTDRPVVEAFGFYREGAHEAGRQQ